MKLDIKIAIVAMISAVITSMFLPRIDSATVSERIAVTASLFIMVVAGFALGLGRDRDGKKIVDKHFDPEE